MDTFDFFDPNTKAGRECVFYTDRKWEVLERQYIYYDTTSIASSVEAIMRKIS